jgi:hypothetical protein
MDGSGHMLFEVGTRDKSLIAQLTETKARSPRRCHDRKKKESWMLTKKKMSQGKNVRRKLRKTYEQQEDKGGGTFGHAKKVRSPFAQQHFLQGGVHQAKGEASTLGAWSNASAVRAGQRYKCAQEKQVKSWQIRSRIEGCKALSSERGA